MKRKNENKLALAFKDIIKNIEFEKSKTVKELFILYMSNHELGKHTVNEVADLCSQQINLLEISFKAYKETNEENISLTELFKKHLSDSIIDDNDLDIDDFFDWVEKIVSNNISNSLIRELS